MKELKRIFFIVSLPLFIHLSCTKEEPLFIDVDSITVTLPNYNGVGEVEVSSNGNWTASAAASWCSITPSAGSGNAIIRVTLSDNGTERERNTTLNIGGGGVTKFVKIVQQSGTLQVNGTPVILQSEGGESSFSITSNSRWSIVVPPEATWLEVTPVSGELNSTILVTAVANPLSQREALLKVQFGSQERSVTVTQRREVNSTPDAPTLKAPADGGVDISLLPPFRWSSSSDDDGDRVNYLFQYSTNPNSWSEPTLVSDTTFYLNHYLEPNSNYWWRVAATDGYDSTSSEWSEGSFTTGETYAYFDRDYSIEQTHSKGSRPSNIIFIGDGYQGEEFSYGGKFDTDMDEGIEAFFAIEPYRSYREYFSIYKVAAYSPENGVSQSDKRIFKKTRFGTDFEGGSTMSIDDNTLLAFVKSVLSVNDDFLTRSVIVLVANQNRYGGTCWMWSDGKAVAIVPVSRSDVANDHYRNLVTHEAGGHGYAKLADEYVNNEGSRITALALGEYNDFLQYQFYPNVDITGSLTEIKWREFFSIEGYSMVGAHEGAFYYSYGAWRPELNSAMRYNDLYYNAPSRAAIVKRILTIAGEQYTLAHFIENDLLRGSYQFASPAVKAISPLIFVPTASPRLFK